MQGGGSGKKENKFTCTALNFENLNLFFNFSENCRCFLFWVFKLKKVFKIAIAI